MWRNKSVTSDPGAQNIKNTKKIHVKSLADGYWQPTGNMWEKVLKLRVQVEWLLHMSFVKHVQRQWWRLKGLRELEISVGRPNEVETILSSVMLEGKSEVFGCKLLWSALSVRDFCWYLQWIHQLSMIIESIWGVCLEETPLSFWLTRFYKMKL